MNPRSASGPNRNADEHRPSRDEAAPVIGIDPHGQTEIVGVNLTDQARAGEDVRRRGWYWHWNTLITQFAPLIGLKGIGLLNSYIVWTDRRDASPYRGYAFPSQQSEADFYGEDRAELGAINQILETLGLIEIRKEMVSRADDKGKWRSLQNFYRVIDREDGCVLTAKDVMAVVELAEKKPAIYRLIRHIFSARFAPIDPGNVWVGILEEVRPTDVWRRLAEKTQDEEERASARSRAGHARRKANLDASDDGDDATPAQTSNDSATGALTMRPHTVVALSNTGSKTGVARSNSGLDNADATNAEPRNTARPTSVEPSSTTYHDLNSTTTTTRMGVDDERRHDAGNVSRLPVTPGFGQVNASAGGETRPAPGDGPAELRAFRAFEEANGRAATPAERRLLTEIATAFDAAAREQSPLHSGWSWLAAAVYEAVDAGSAYVAPRRAREIMTRWRRDGAPASLGGGVRHRETQPETARQSVQAAPAPAETAAETVDMAEPVRSIPATPAPAVEQSFKIEGMPSRHVWEAALDEIVANQDVSRADRDNWLRPARLGGWSESGELIVIAPGEVARKRIAGRMRVSLRRALTAVTGRVIELDVRVAEPFGPDPLDDARAS